MSWFSSCECGYYNCGYCRPHLEANDRAASKRKKEEEKSKAKEQKRRDKLYRESLKFKMPWGKHEGTVIDDLTQAYCFHLLKHQEKNIVDDKLKELLKYRAEGFVEFGKRSRRSARDEYYRLAAEAYDYEEDNSIFDDDFDPYDP